MNALRTWPLTSQSAIVNNVPCHYCNQDQEASQSTQPYRLSSVRLPLRVKCARQRWSQPRNQVDPPLRSCLYALEHVIKVVHRKGDSNDGSNGATQHGQNEDHFHKCALTLALSGRRSRPMEQLVKATSSHVKVTRLVLGHPKSSSPPSPILRTTCLVLTREDEHHKKGSGGFEEFRWRAGK